MNRGPFSIWRDASGSPEENPPPFSLWAVLAAPAQAQPPQCNTRDYVLSLLAGKYKEAPVAVGVTNAGSLVEVLSTGTGSTWTIIVTTPQGMSCLIAAGEGWRKVVPKIAGADS